MSEDFVFRAIDVEKDTEKLAAMWNASDDQWPGTWSGGVPITPTMVRERLDREARLEASICETEDAIAGFCSVWKDLEESDVAYVALLNVSPEHQGKSLGRKFLVHWVDKCKELGYNRLDLHTWSGNLKAVPLYKKTGFFWMPQTESGGTHMLNFIPGILSMPPAKPFFDKHGWYESFQRELAQEEDDERWEGMKVFTYRFAADGDELTAWADRLSRRITAVETGKLFAAALAPDLEPPRGLPATIQWRLKNKTDKPMQVSLVAVGGEFLKVDHRETLELSPSEEATLEAKVEIEANIPESKVQKDKPAPAVKTILLVDGQVIELGTGLRPQRAIEIDTHPAPISISASNSRDVHVQLRNRMKQDVEAKVSVAPVSGLTSDWTEKQVSLAAEGYAGVPITLTTEGSGSFELPISVSFEAGGQQVEVPAIPRYAFALPPEGILAEKGEQAIRIENERIRVTLAEGGSLGIADRGTGRSIGSEYGYPGPPFAPSEYWTAIFDLELEREPGAVIAIANYVSKREPGFALSKRVRVTAAPWVEVTYEFQNLGPHRRHMQLNQSVNGGETSWITMPLRAGLVRAPSGDFPGQSDEEAKKPETYAERWVSFEGNEATLGAVWSKEISEITWESGIRLLGELFECPPQSRISPAPLLIGITDGGWQGVRKAWRRHQGIDDRHEPLPEAGLALQVRTEPSVLVATNGKVEGKLMVEHFRSRPVTGSARLQLPEGWTSSTAEFPLEEVTVHKPGEFDLSLETSVKPGGTVAKIEVRSPDADEDFEVPLVRLGDGGSVKVRETASDGQTLLTVDNGLLEFDAAPGFAGIISSIRRDGVEHLSSSFPKESVLGWFSPWHGGITPTVLVGESFPGRLYKETFSGAAHSDTDAAGIEWQGVRVATDLEDDEELRGLRFELDALTTGGSPVIKLVIRLVNRTSVYRRPAAGWIAYVQPDGSRSDTLLHTSDYRVKHSARFVFSRAGRWGAAQNPESRGTIIAMTAKSELFTLVWAGQGGHLAMLDRPTVPPDGAAELVAYLALAPDLESAKGFLPLKDL